MKKLLPLIMLALLSLLTHSAHAQEEGTVEKSIVNIQAGTIGFWGNYEGRLGNKWALRAEGGFELWLYDTFSDGRGSVLVPSVSVEPRYYYNITKRHAKGKNTRKNSASFVTVSVEYFPDAFVLGNLPKYLYVPDQLHIIPKWGMRRMIGNHFNYEIGGGIGYEALLVKKPSNLDASSDVVIDIHLRIGYTF